MKRREAWIGFAFAMPAVAMFAAFAWYPILRTAYLSLFDYNMLQPPVFKGPGNYVSLMADPLFWQSVRATIGYVAGTCVPVWGLSLGLALLLNRPLRLRGALRSLYFSPAVMSMVVAAVMWKLLLHYRGLLNVLGGYLGLGPIPWLTDAAWAPVSLIVMSIWKSTGYYMVMYLAGLQSIPGEYVEAALIDGANRWQAFKSVTLPLLRPVTVLVVTMSLITGMQEFTAQFVMTGGGPSGATRVLALLIYETGFVFMKMGRATAISMLLLAGLVALTLLQRRWLQASETF